MKHNISKIILYVLIFCAGILVGFFWWDVHKNLWNQFLDEPVITEVLEEDSPVDNNYQQDQESRIFHGDWYVQKFWKIYFHSKEVKNADGESFEYLRDWFAKDKNNYYFWEKALYLSDGVADRWEYTVGENFEILKWWYAKDEKYIYYQDYWFFKHNNWEIKIIPENSDYKNFLHIWDKIFYWNQEQTDIDTQTFSHLKYNYFQDKYWIYFWNNLLTLSKNYYKIIDEKFIKDDRNVFLNWEYKPQLDAKSFKKLEVPENHMYFLDLYSDTNWFYTFNQYSHNFYKLKNNISQENIKKCLNNENFCKSMLWY